VRLHRPRDLLVGLAFAALGAFAVIEAAGLPSMPGMGVGSGLFPTITGAGMILFGLILALKGFAPGAAGPPPAPAPDPRAEEMGAAEAAPPLDVVFAAVVLGGLVALIFLLRPLGFLLTAGVFGAVVARVGGASLPGAVLFGAAASAGLYQIFVYGLGVPLPRGLLSF
jgi:hypothetical protein